ncbi:DUF4386 family protein [Actinokineospora bangkokensis]|uniref:DUF4386 domain-containing protein n=1 Tax=Actinokineospora bangkokensis TaxID=1193682 RepID=A0A1Q9LPN3_9PSEU|nr:DUF4386 family protein [Actinokineospora bangkokensis]OLR94007.1 hypothetical protein BJP25_13600 [Actinokineospora bangkokensis]
MRDRALGVLMIGGAVAANAAFAVLGPLFDYPDVLGRPAPEVLDRFHGRPVPIAAAFLLLAAGAGLLAPIALRLRAHARRGRAVAAVGVAAAAVQVVGLLRWPLVVPFLDRDDVGTFRALHAALGTALGETAGYLLTAAWTALVVAGLGSRMPGGPLTRALAVASAPMVAAGALAPLGVPGVDEVNFAGYVLWSLWLIACGTFFIIGARKSNQEQAGSHTPRTPAATAHPSM